MARYTRVSFPQTLHDDDVSESSSSGSDDEEEPLGGSDTETFHSSESSSAFDDEEAFGKGSIGCASWKIMAGRVVFVAVLAASVGLLAGLPAYTMIRTMEDALFRSNVDATVQPAQDLYHQIVSNQLKKGTNAMAQIAAFSFPEYSDWSNNQAWIEGFSDLAAGLLPSSTVLFEGDEKSKVLPSAGLYVLPLVRPEIEEHWKQQQQKRSKATANDSEFVLDDLVVHTTTLDSNTPWATTVKMPILQGWDSRNNNETTIPQREWSLSSPLALHNITGWHIVDDAIECLRERQLRHYGECHASGLVREGNTSRLGIMVASPVFPRHYPEVLVGFVVGVLSLEDIFREIASEYLRTRPDPELYPDNPLTVWNATAELELECMVGDGTAAIYGWGLMQRMGRTSTVFLGGGGPTREELLEIVESVGIPFHFRYPPEDAAAVLEWLMADNQQSSSNSSSSSNKPEGSSQSTRSSMPIPTMRCWPRKSLYDDDWNPWADTWGARIVGIAPMAAALIVVVASLFYHALFDFRQY